MRRSKFIESGFLCHSVTQSFKLSITEFFNSFNQYTLCDSALNTEQPCEILCSLLFSRFYK